MRPSSSAQTVRAELYLFAAMEPTVFSAKGLNKAWACSSCIYVTLLKFWFAVTKQFILAQTLSNQDSNCEQA